MSRVRRTIGLFSAVALLFLGTALVGTASAVVPACGTVITTNITLTGDVGPCNSGNGLVIGASNITLDLAGYQVYSNAPLPRQVNGQPSDVVGIYLFEVSNVTVKNGSVIGFAAGVAIEYGGSNLITGITARDNRGLCIGEDFSTQAQGTFGDGIVLFSSANNRIENNRTIHNGPFSGIAIVANTEAINFPISPLPTGNKVLGNFVDDNRTCFADIGIRIEGPAASNNTVSGNTVNRSFQEGIGIAAVNNINFSGIVANPPTCQNRGFPSEFTGNFVAGSPLINLTAGTFSAADVGKTITIFLPSNLPPGNIDPFAPGPAVTIVSVQSGTQATASRSVVTSFTGRQFSLRPPCPGKTGAARTPTNDNNTVSGNTVTNGGFGGQEDPPRGRAQVENASGLAMISFCQGSAATGPLSLNGKGNVFQGNTVRGNASSGVSVGGCSPTSQQTGFTNGRILGNTAVGNNVRAMGGFDLRDSNMNCDANVWRGNRYGTANPACTTVGGTDVDGGAAAAAQAAEGSGGAERTIPTRGNNHPRPR